MGHVYICVLYGEAEDIIVDATAKQFNANLSFVVRPYDKKLPWYWTRIEREMQELWELEQWTQDWGKQQKVRRRDYEILL